MKNTLKIGTCQDTFISLAADQMIDSLFKSGIKCELVPIETFGSSTKSALYDAIMTNTIDAAPFELACLPPFSGDEEVIVSAISGRTHEGYALLLKKNNAENTNSQNLEAGLKLGVQTERQLLQLKNLFPHLSCDYLPYIQKTDATLEIPDNLDGIILSKFHHALFTHKYKDYTFVGLHPKELIPAPGHGIVAYLCHCEDINTRKLLQLIHTKSMVQISNTERMVLKLAGNEFRDTLGVFCQRDHRGYFHIQAVRCDQFKKVSFSQSISTGLAEKIFQSLFS